MITIKSRTEIEKMRLAGKITGDALRIVEKHIKFICKIFRQVI